MARHHRAVNVATITEEDVVGEEVGENGMVEVVDIRDIQETNERLEEERRSSVVVLDRSDSLVEKDVQETNESLLTALVLSSSSQGLSRSTSTSSSGQCLSRSASTSSINSSVSSTSEKQAGGGSPRLRRTASRGGGRTLGYTMNLSGKFVTELTMFDPSDPTSKRSHINLGIFLATDQAMGDHSVYKVSPVSPLALLKIKPQDRLVRLNDLPVEGWSHSCVVDFVRNLTLTDATLAGSLTSPVGKAPGGRTYVVPLCLEYRRTGKMVRSADEAPVSRRVEARLKIRKKRATVDSVKESEVRLRYTSMSQARLRLKDDRPLFLKMADGSDIPGLEVGESNEHGERVCFTLHLFTSSHMSQSGGHIVVIQGHEGGLIHAYSPNSVGILQGTTMSVQVSTQIDMKHFTMGSSIGDGYLSFRHVLTGNYLTASPNGVGLSSPPSHTALPKECLFQVHYCQH